jgi:predicted GIY-YIG superfamily endonuclease
MTFWTYMLHCRGGLFYTGHTDNLEARMGQHQSGAIPGFTRDHAPVTLVWSQEFPTRVEALAAERQIKGWSKSKKLALIRGDWPLISALAKGKNDPSTSSGRTEVAEEARTNSVRAELVEAVPLTCHPDTPSRAVTAITVKVESRRGERASSHLGISYRLWGDVNSVALPERNTGGRTDNLWQHTCFEAFVKQTPSEQYLELNFAPSFEWAAYHFVARREGMTSAPFDPPKIWSRRTQAVFDLHVSLNHDNLRPILQSPDPWQLALSAVIEETNGTKSYWALRHPPGKPDFHHPDCFALELAAPDLA